MSNAKDLVLAWYERVWNQRDASAIDDMASPEFVHEGVLGDVVKGPEGLRALHAAVCAAFSETHFAVSDVVVEGSRAAYRYQAQLTHRATGKKANVGGMAILDMKDGMLFHGLECIDWLPMLQALDLAQPDGFDKMLGG